MSKQVSYYRHSEPESHVSLADEDEFRVMQIIRIAQPDGSRIERHGIRESRDDRFLKRMGGIEETSYRKTGQEKESIGGNGQYTFWSCCFRQILMGGS